MTIDEAIESKKKLISEWINEISLTPNNDISYLKKCQDMISYYNQEIEWLEELKAIKEIDLEIPQHFTKEQREWIKTYCIERNVEFYNQAIDDIRNVATYRQEGLSGYLTITPEELYGLYK